MALVISCEIQSVVKFLCTICRVATFSLSQSGTGMYLPLPFLSPPSPSLLPPSPFASLPLYVPSLTIEVGPLKSSWEVWGSAVSSPSGVWGGVPAEILALKSDIWKFYAKLVFVTLQ